MLAAACEKYIDNEYMQKADILLMRAYFRKWIDSPAWDSHPDLDDAEKRTQLAELRRRVRDIDNRLDIDHWLYAAMQLHVDPM